MVDLVGIQSNIVKIDQLISRTSDHWKPLKPHSDRKVSNWNLDGGHLSYQLAPLRKLGPAVGYANISGSIWSFKNSELLQNFLDFIQKQIVIHTNRMGKVLRFSTKQTLSFSDYSSEELGLWQISGDQGWLNSAVLGGGSSYCIKK